MGSEEPTTRSGGARRSQNQFTAEYSAWGK